jgi:hypothetical protein
MTIDQIQTLKAIQARLENSTKGTWKFDGTDDPAYLETEESIVIRLEDQYPGYAECGEDLRMDIDQADREFIEMAHNHDIQFLLDLIATHYKI